MVTTLTIPATATVTITATANDNDHIDGHKYYFADSYKILSMDFHPFI